MAAILGGDPEGFGEDEPDGELIIPAIYQRVIPQQREQFINDGDESSPEEDPEDYDLAAPPLES